MEVRVPVIVKDPSVVRWKGTPLTENFVIKSEDHFLDGPVTARVAVVDFDPDSKGLATPVRFIPPSDGKPGKFDIPPVTHETLSNPQVMQVLCFGAVYKTLDMFEEPDTLGRKVRWAFPGTQLLVVPRAGEWANAFYERDSQSLQLFFVSRPDSVRIYTCHSQDIVAHETAHAAIDGIAPDLYHSANPQGLALHESLADFAALMMAFRCRPLADAILDHTGGDIRSENAFTGIAEQLGETVGRGESLRDLHNRNRMSDIPVGRPEPHAMSMVLSGALYDVMVKIYEHVRAERPDKPSGYALFVASERFKRFILRGLDYLPPGEITFSDFGRAVIASDLASHPDSDEPRQWLGVAFVERGIIGSETELEPKGIPADGGLDNLDLDELLSSDWRAYQWVAEHRKLLNIPPDIPFEVRPRLSVNKLYFLGAGVKALRRECLLKVSWSEVEPCNAGPNLPKKRRILRGTTVAIDWETRSIRAIVTGQSSDATRHTRDQFVRNLVEDGLLRINEAAVGPDGNPLRNFVRGEVIADTLKLRATAQALHVAGRCRHG